MIKTLYDFAASRATDHKITLRLREIILTMGSEGVLIYNGSDFTHYPGRHLGQTDIKSVVGAGDSFLGGFVTGVYQGRDQPAAVELG